MFSDNNGIVPLKDTIIPYNEFENTGDGFSFHDYNADDMLYVIIIYMFCIVDNIKHIICIIVME